MLHISVKQLRKMGVLNFRKEYILYFILINTSIDFILKKIP